MKAVQREIARVTTRVTSRVETRAQFASDALLAEPWTGPVERVAELSAERRVALGLPAVERRRSEVMIRLCQNPYCRSWTATRLAWCVVCHL